MIVADFKGASEVSTPTELEAALKKRYGHNANSFWLSHPPMRDPSLAILVRGDLASINYFPGDGSAGFRSVGHVGGLEPGEMSIFYLDSEKQELPMLNDSIVPFSDALKAALEFFVSAALPVSMEWFEL